MRPDRSAADGVVLDAGAFIAAERGERTAGLFLARLMAARVPIVTSAAVVAQVWRGGGARQAPIAFLLRRTVIVDLTAGVSRTLGRILADSRTSDPIDAHVVLLARERDWSVLTSDPDDLLAIDPTLRVERV